MTRLDFKPVASGMTLAEHVDDILTVLRAELLRHVAADEEGSFAICMKLRGDLVPEVFAQIWVPRRPTSPESQ